MPTHKNYFRATCKFTKDKRYTLNYKMYRNLEEEKQTRTYKFLLLLFYSFKHLNGRFFFYGFFSNLI